MATIQELFSLEGKVALVTGARNLGYYAAETLCELGATVAVTTRDLKRSEKIATDLQERKKVKVLGVELEVTNEENWKKIVSKIISEFGKIDILINNAGGRNPEIINEVYSDDITNSFLEGRPLESWRSTIDINLTSVFLGCKSVIPYMKKEKYGKIVNIASIDGVVGRDLELYRGTGLSPTVPDYLASKGGIISLTKGIAVAFAKYGINVNSISPGGFLRGQPDEFVRKYSARVPLGRMGKDDTDLKGAIAYLCSRASDYVTGHNLIVDGGWTAW